MDGRKIMQNVTTKCNYTPKIKQCLNNSKNIKGQFVFAADQLSNIYRMWSMRTQNDKTKVQSI